MNIPPFISIVIVWAIVALSVAGAAAASEVEVDASGQQHDVTTQSQTTQQQQRSPPQPVKATFINRLPQTTVNLYWAGNAKPSETGGQEDPPSSRLVGGLQLFYGPLEANGGSFTVDAYTNSIFVLTEAGTYNRLGEFVLKESDDKGTIVLTQDSAMKTSGRFPPKSLSSSQREELGQSCRTLNGVAKASDGFLDRCQACAEVEGCSYSMVRSRASSGKEGCYASHALATINDVQECQQSEKAMEEAGEKSADAWMNAASALMLGESTYGYGAKSLRLAYRYLEKAVERAEQTTGTSSSMAAKKSAAAMLAELSAKLDAVMDDVDAKELLAASRHPKLAEIHPDMPMVHRRTSEEAIHYIARGEPVVITDMFDDDFNPVVHKWTLQYLNRNVFSDANATTASGEAPKFNVAADVATRCCRYFEPQGRAKEAQYPYPFAPTTHLYRNTFDGFVKTIRKAARDAYSSIAAGKAPSPRRVLHYLHEIVMNAEGEAVVAGGTAPEQLAQDLETITSQIRGIASHQPFFGKFANAKVWIGQRDIVMPIHYDATDNLYLMAWGRKKAYIGEPGQLDDLYRFPNGHPLAGSSQVNLTQPDLERHPRFKNARLREVVVGPGDVLYLPAWWWHQFEQPFEDTAALNLWSKDRNGAPEASLRDTRICEHLLADQLEESAVQLFGNEAGIVLQALANGAAQSEPINESKLKQAEAALTSAAEAWHLATSDLPGEHPKKKQAPSLLMKEYLENTYRGMMAGERTSWKPGDGWDLSQIAKLPRELRDQCKEAPELSPFMSLC